MFLTAVEVAKLADTIDQRYRGMVLLGCWGGLRFGKQVGLRVRCVNPLHGTVLVERAVVEVAGRQLQGPPKTAAGRRTERAPLWFREVYLGQVEPDDFRKNNRGELGTRTATLDRDGIAKLRESWVYADLG
jgi:hypothetical protein